MRGEVQCRVPSKATTDALIRLRRAEEQEATRRLRQARDGVERATAAREAAVGAWAALKQRLERLAAASGHTTAGTLSRRDAFRAQLRKQLDAARARVDGTQRVIKQAFRDLEAAQKALEQALRARQATEVQRDAAETAEARRRERRDQSASDDRWRPPRG
jgi:chromosome segregation ATPase